MANYKHPQYNYYGTHVETNEVLGPLSMRELVDLGHNPKKVKNHIKMDKSFYHKMKWHRVPVIRGQ